MRWRQSEAGSVLVISVTLLAVPPAVVTPTWRVEERIHQFGRLHLLGPTSSPQHLRVTLPRRPIRGCRLTWASCRLHSPVCAPHVGCVCMAGGWRAPSTSVCEWTISRCLISWTVLCHFAIQPGSRKSESECIVQQPPLQSGMYSVLESEPMTTCLVDRWLDTYCSLLDSAHEHTPTAVSWTEPMNTCLLDRWLNTYCSLLDWAHEHLFGGQVFGHLLQPLGLWAHEYLFGGQMGGHLLQSPGLSPWTPVWWTGVWTPTAASWTMSPWTPVCWTGGRTPTATSLRFFLGRPKHPSLMCNTKKAAVCTTGNVGDLVGVLCTWSCSSPLTKLAVLIQYKINRAF